MIISLLTEVLHAIVLNLTFCSFDIYNYCSGDMYQDVEVNSLILHFGRPTDDSSSLYSIHSPCLGVDFRVCIQ